MTLNEFVKKYDGHPVDFDKMYGPQCVDLFRQYCKDVYKIPHTGSVVGAKDLYEKYEVMEIEQRYFTKRSKGKPGDVAVWGATETNRYGHVAILLSDMGTDILVFEQDGYKQDGAKIKMRSKQNLLGYLSKKGA